MQYAIIKNGLIENIVVADKEYADQRGWIECPAHDGAGRSIGPGDIFVDGTFKQSPQTIEALAQSVRAQRDALLAASDISVLPDRWAAMSDEQKSAWSTYRQALRDITAQPGFPLTIVWPDQPAQ